MAFMFFVEQFVMTIPKVMANKFGVRNPALVLERKLTALK